MVPAIGPFGGIVANNNMLTNPWQAQIPFSGIGVMPPATSVWQQQIPQQQQQIPQQQQQQQQHQQQQLQPFNQTQSPVTNAYRTITIDGIPRELRFYDEVAIAFMNAEGTEPREIGFQAGERRVMVDKIDTILLAFNDTYKPFVIDGETYQIRFGSPIRELYINNQWYECFFGDPPVVIPLAGKQRVFQIEGPSPQVRIGSLRTDLVAGKVDVYIDVQTKITLFLDAQQQQFELDHQTHTIQFADYFLTVIIDGEPFMVEYGAMPKRFRIGGRDRHIRFSVLPDGVQAGRVFIKNMKRTDAHCGITSPIPIVIADVVPPPVVSNALPAAVPSSNVAAATSAVNTTASTPPSLNIHDLLQQLVASGILNSKTSDVDTAKEKPKEKPKPIDLSKNETLKQRQSCHIQVLFSGMQCSSCGVRFPPEQTIKYSQHLDWHFRQNRRDRDSARRAHSRRWYYDVADWIQYEEIEDLDEREKNWFETQQSEMEPNNEDSAHAPESAMQSCVAGPDDVDRTCDMCHDQFETFYNEETEDWHLRNAVRIDDNTYHPICYEDHKVEIINFSLILR